MQGSSTAKLCLPLILVSAAIAMFMASLDGTIVNIALPSIAKTFSLTSSSVSWVSTIYLLVTAGTMLIAGKLADTFGYKKLFIIGFSVFTVGSFFCGSLPVIFDSYAVLLASRVIQALGGVLMLVIAPALITSNLPMERQGKGMALIMLFASLGIALGPTLGGIITQVLSWHWVFFINVPVGIIAVVLALKFLPRDGNATASMKGFDGIGAALIFVGIAALLFFISEGSTLGWGSVPVIVALVLAVFGIGGFIFREKRAALPILDLTMFKNRTFTLENLIYAVSYLIFGGAFFLMPFYLEKLRMLDSAQSGLVLSTLSVGLMVAGLLAGGLYARLAGKRKYLVAASLLLLAVGFFLLSHLNPVSGMGIIITGLSCLGLGVGAITTALSTMVLSTAPADKKAMVSSLVTLERTAPMTIGIALFNLLFIAGVKYVANHMTITETPIMQVLPEILADGFDFCFVIGMILALVIFVLSFFIREPKTSA